MSDDIHPLTGFTGVARLFPLPNIVLFPHVMQPLHIFEDRYRQMTADALQADRLIAMVLLKPGWETTYAARPAIYSVGCVGKIIAEQKLDDGRYNILLRGMSRVRIVHELVQSTLYRQARVELLEDTPALGEAREKKWRRLLSKLVSVWVPKQGGVLQQFRKLLKSDIGLGPLCDILSFALPLEVEVKQELLEELDIERRVKRLLKSMVPDSSKLPTSEEKKFPPEFSVN